MTPAMQRLLAYCGDEAASLACADHPGGPPCASPGDDPCECDEPSVWIKGLPSLVKAATERECDGDHGPLTVFWTCCVGTGKVTEPSHPLLRIALRVAWAVGNHWTAPTAREALAITAALRACEAWLADPSEENREAWRSALDGFTSAPPAWVPFPLASFIGHPKAPHSRRSFYLAAKIGEAADTIGLPAMRDAALEEVREWI